MTFVMTFLYVIGMLFVFLCFLLSLVASFVICMSIGRNTVWGPILFLFCLAFLSTVMIWLGITVLVV